MSAGDLLSELEKNAPPSLQGHPALKKAVELMNAIGACGDGFQAGPIIRLAQRIRISALQEDDNLYRLENGVEINLQDLVASDFLVSKIAFWIETVRDELFGAPQAPFDNDIENAINWIETTAKSDMENNNPVNAGEGKEAFPGAEQEETGLPFMMRSIYLPSKSRVKSLWVQPGTLLYHLSRKAENMSRSTGFNRHSLTIYILTGLEPIMPRVTVSVNLGRANLPLVPQEDNNDFSENDHYKLAKRSLKIEIHSADLSPGELKNLYEQYRRALKVRKTKSLSSEQVRLYYLVSTRGGPPGRGSKAFWQSIKDEWNSNGSNKPYRSWEGVYQRYKIIERKMDNLYSKK